MGREIETVQLRRFAHSHVLFIIDHSYFFLSGWVEERSKQDALVENIAELVLDFLWRGGIEQVHQASLAVLHALYLSSELLKFGIAAGRRILGLNIRIGILTQHGRTPATWVLRQI
jgi:hypothetical protein